MQTCLNFFEMQVEPFTNSVGRVVSLLVDGKEIVRGELFFVGIAPLHAALNRSDVVTVTIGRTPFTFSREEFAQLKINS